MKTIASLLLFTLLGLSAQARTELGSQCGLIDFADDFELSEDLSLDLTENSKLTPLQKKQVLATVDSNEPISVKEALKWLVESSEGGDVYYSSGKFEGRAYQVVKYYPGGNPVGAIFKKGSTRPLAFISDSDILCAQKN